MTRARHGRQARHWWSAPMVVHAATLEAVTPPAPGDGMTLGRATPPAATAAPGEPDPGRRPHAPRPAWVSLVSGAALIVGALMVGFVLVVAVVSQVREARDQDVLYSQFRSDLANATAPTGQTDVNGVLLVPGTPVAVLRIPSLGVDQVVVEGTTSSVLTAGPGHKRDSVLPGQAGTSVLYGRQAAYGGPFGGLADLRPGDEFTALTGQGEHRYRVVDLRYAGDPLPTPVAQGKGRLVLVTAAGTPYLPNGVLRVDADLVSPVQPAGQVVLAAGSLAEAEAPMAGDPEAWFGVALWSGALLIVALAMTWAWWRWGRWQAWLVGVPVLLFCGLALADRISLLLPNLM